MRLLSRLYNGKYLKYWETLYSHENFFGTGPTKLAKFAEPLIKKHGIKKILEIGCGQGRDALHFARLGYNVEAFDLSSNAVDFVNKHKEQLGLENLNVITHDTTKPLVYRPKEFDFVYSNLALQFFNFETIKTILENISLVMKDNSLLFFSTKKAGDKYFEYGKKINENAYENKGVTRYFFDEKTINESLQNNFKLLEILEHKHTNLDDTVSVWWKILARKI